MFVSVGARKGVRKGVREEGNKAKGSLSGYDIRGRESESVDLNRGKEVLLEGTKSASFDHNLNVKCIYVRNRTF